MYAVNPHRSSIPAELESYPWSTDFHISYARNLPGDGRNSTPYYEANRIGATEDWDVSRGGGTLSIYLQKRMVARGILGAQYSTEPLISANNSGLAAQNSVRGFEEREVSGDSGTRVSVEIWSQAIESLGGARFLGFADAGRISRRGTLVPTQTACGMTYRLSERACAGSGRNMWASRWMSRKSSRRRR